MHDLHDLIRQYGSGVYLLTFLWTAMEGETFVIFAGLFAQKGMLNIGLLFLAAWSGSFAGDQAFFFLGRQFGTRILRYFPRLQPPADRALGWLERHAIAFILAYRFMYGIRNISGIAIGMSQMSRRKFMFWNAVAAFVWAAAFLGFGYVYGDVLAHMHHKREVVQDSVRQLMLGMMGLFVTIVLMRALVAFIRKRRRAAELKRTADELVSPPPAPSLPPSDSP